MASTVLPNGIIVPEKFSRDWYSDLYHNWQELDNLLAGGGANDGTLTIQKNGTTVGTFSANQVTDETVNITVPDVNNGTLTIQQNGTTVDTFSANSSSDKTVNITVPDVNDGTLTIQQNGTTVDTFTANSSSDKTVNVQCVDLTSNQTVGGIKTFSNAPVVGSIDLDGKSIDTDANGNMTYDGHIVDTIEEQGDGYIRYSNGLQICWGSISWQSTCSDAWGSLYETSGGSGSYAKSFVDVPSVSALGCIGNASAMMDVSIITSGTVTPAFYLCRAAPIDSVQNCIVRYIAIGKWK